MVRDEQIISFNQIVWAMIIQKRQTGRPTTEQIIEIIPQLCRSLNIYKDMALQQIQNIIQNIDQIECEVLKSYDQNQNQYKVETLEYEHRQQKIYSVFEQKEYNKIKLSFYNQYYSDAFKQLIQYTKNGCSRKELEDLRRQLLLDARKVKLWQYY